METKRTIQRLSKTKSCFFDKPLAKLTKRKREMTKLNKIGDEKR
jgi:hypothetical protein